MKTEHTINVTDNYICMDGKELTVQATGEELLKQVYYKYIGNYPKFHKMDVLSKLGFIASELLLQAEGCTRFEERSDRAIILFGKNASVCNDREYQKTIENPDNFYPSPSVFVYTLPNIVAGEIALRNKYHGETSYIIVENKEQMKAHMERIVNTSAQTSSFIYGWLDAPERDVFEAEMCIVKP